MASRASCSRSSPWSSITVSTPSSLASSTSPNCLTFPPPDHGLQMSTGWRGRVTEWGRRASCAWSRPHHGQTRGSDRYCSQDHYRRQPDQRPVTVRRGDDGGDDDDQADDRGPQPDPASRRMLSDQPPSAGPREGQPDDHGDQRGKVADPEHEEHRGEQEAASDGDPGQRSLTSGDGRLLRTPLCRAGDARSHFAIAHARHAWRRHADHVIGVSPPASLTASVRVPASRPAVRWRWRVPRHRCVTRRRACGRWSRPRS